MSTLPRISYNSILVDFDRGVNVWNLLRDQRRVENESASGIVETLSYFERERIAIQRRVASADLQAQLEQFWLYARTGQTFSFWRDRDLSGYWDFEGKSYTSNDSVAGTFTRATTAYYTDPTDGLVKSVASGSARFPAGKFGRGILLERAATNILLRSAELDNGSWTATNVTVTANTTETLDPNGGTTAEKCVATVNNGTLRQDTSTSISTDDATFSVYLRNGTTDSSSVTIYIIRADTGATLASSAVSTTQSWQKFQVSYDNSGSIAANWGVKIEFPTTADSFYAWGTQLEVGASILSASSYIPTTSAAATRNIDILSFTASSFFNDVPQQGSISFWYAPTFSSSQNNLTRHLFLLQLAVNNINLYIDTNETLIFTTTTLASVSVTATSSTVTLTSGTFVHICVTWDTTIANGLKIYVNGALVATSSNSAFSISRTSTNIYIGSNGGAIGCDGIIDEFEIRKDVLTAGQIANYYNSGRARGWRRNYYSSLLIDQSEYAPDLMEGGWRHNIPLIFKEVLT